MGRPRGSKDRRGKARLVDGRALGFVVRAFGEQMRRAREEANVSASELAAAVQLDVATIHRYENASARPSLRSVVAIAMALGVPVEHLVPEV